jgi:thiosulfate/3-mercaptopyruvate sulfurtransferase
MVNQCTACHGSRVGDECFGDRGSGDVHIADGGMDCVDCHGAEEMHASGEGLKSRYELAEMPKCVNCHEDLKGGDIKQHNLHVGKVQCNVCHSQEYVNCYSCHIGKDDQGLAYFQNRREVETMKIGKAYPGSAAGDATYVLVRHVPSDPEAFDYYRKGAFPEFDSLPTWKRASPHNIRRSTWQNSNCNNCHGRRDLFLAESDLLDYEKAANASVVVADEEVPKTRTGIDPVPKADVVAELLVSPEHLHELLVRKEAVLIDARPEADYKKDHIEGAISFDAARHLRYGPKHERAMLLKSVSELARYAGEMGLDGSENVVIYDAGGLRGTLLFLALERIGHKKVAILDGGLEGWEEEGYLTVHGDPPKVAAKTFSPQADDSVIVSNEALSGVLSSSDTVVLDVRSIAQHVGVRKHALASAGGAIKGSTNLPVRALWSVEGFMKDPEVIAWVLAGQGITPDKTVITTCNTSQLASGAYFALRYLGYGKVKVHDGSWVSWEQYGQEASAAPAQPPPAVTAAPPPPAAEEEEEEDQFGC